MTDIPEDRQKILWWIGGVAAVVFVLFLWPSEHRWDGQGTVNLFPSADSVKNYRLDADLSVDKKNHGWLRHDVTYSVTRADWPDGGTADFDGCSVKQGGSASCSDQDGHVYTIEVMAAPDEPQDDTSSSDY